LELMESELNIYNDFWGVKTCPNRMISILKMLWFEYETMGLHCHYISLKFDGIRKHCKKELLINQNSIWKGKQCLIEKLDMMLENFNVCYKL
jgi:hypothetical protein